MIFSVRNSFELRDVFLSNRPWVVISHLGIFFEKWVRQRADLEQQQVEQALQRAARLEALLRCLEARGNR
jgi:hypothetical protein